MSSDYPIPLGTPTVLQRLLIVVSIPGNCKWPFPRTRRARLTPGKPESPLHFRVWSDQQLSYLAEAVAEKLGVATESIGFKDGHENALTTVLRIEELDLCGAWFNEGYGHRVEAIIPE
ncbi:hypothetical protein FN846DRAFT_914296 [Sphaerosporella brunnea]|uniref:Uncharacterized protein n=1 Tax=Sphaerosporella brunnea TaxID=1250544 RepID=A0A5J5ECI8_9PEZI|nr:hypothetical protein FN846DRAFT_914296 [Sphaerosporella brunnea]